MTEIRADMCTRCCGAYVEWDTKYGELILYCPECGEEVRESDLVPDHEIWQCEECGKWCGFGDGYEVETGSGSRDLCHACSEKLGEGVSEDAGLRKSA